MENVGWNFEMVAYTLKFKKRYNENKIHRNANNSCGTSSTMKHESFHLGFFLRSFVFKGISHSTKSLDVWQLVLIHATGTLVWCALNTINVNKWNFTSFMPKVASIEIAPLSPNQTTTYNWNGIYIPIVNETWIPLFSFASWK